jgi:hypothetical protein
MRMLREDMLYLPFVGDGPRRDRVGVVDCPVAAGGDHLFARRLNVADGLVLLKTVLGAVFAIVHGGPDGLRLAMLLGGVAQLTSAVVAWTPTEQLK